MAEIEAGRGGAPSCSGCGATLPYVHWFLSSKIREPYAKDAGRYGSMGLEVAAFAREHTQCPAPQRSVSENGIVIVDRRRSREATQ